MPLSLDIDEQLEDYDFEQSVIAQHDNASLTYNVGSNNHTDDGTLDLG